MDEEKIDIQCGRCQIPLEYGKRDLNYQRQSISTEVLRCPKCGQVYLPESLVKGKMFEVEKALEDK